MTLRQSLTEAAATLATDPRLSEQARRDAELLLLNILQIDRATLLAHPDRDITSQQLETYDAAIARRLSHEPIQYITGEQEFFGLRLKVTPATLIPRPETEHLVEAVLDRLPHDQPLNILDVGTGTGAIALALAAHLPQARITAVDISAEALEVARENAAAHNLSDRIRFHQTDLISGLPQDEERIGFFDAVVSNPPYIPEDDRASLHPQVRDHEPEQALFAGQNGLDIYCRLIPQAHAALLPGGLLAMEIGHGQRDALSLLLADWRDVEFVADLQQIPRVALARR
ncbi:MAG: protein-(glutamine-N5) methyltransferase, release factor-specific [Acidobacteriales bacterium 59-55]|nr:peptide chain release factor N(5)-glutamine methyltransferase [Terriglobales bacterium]ODU53965.1 MAG: protein-(glutamine-N5) methyltransferase, release factor-specific [Granulicella sp. SCN 62-9]OJV44465.1 MAG: protein-(glutamine-N5) methyltransferase, release factor-specific [Acidobacteriales bacterium 59-55]